MICCSLRRSREELFGQLGGLAGYESRHDLGDSFDSGDDGGSCPAEEWGGRERLI